MATRTFYLKDEAVSGFGKIENGSAPGAATTGTGWTVAKLAANNYSDLLWGTKRTSGAFGTTVLPADGAPTGGNALRTVGPLTGTFAAGDWTVALRVIAVSAGGTQDGRARYRVFKGANADGSGATELTSGTTEGGLVTDLGTGAEQATNATISLGSVVLSNEYLFVKLAWRITGAGGNNSCDVLLRVGANSYLLTPDFTEIVTGSALGSGAGGGAAAGSVLVDGTAAGSGVASGTATGETAAPGVEGSAAGSGVGTGSATGQVWVNGAASGSAIGSGSAAGQALVAGLAAGSGAGSGTAVGDLRVDGAAVGSGAGGGSAAGGAFLIDGSAVGSGVGGGQASGVRVRRTVEWVPLGLFWTTEWQAPDDSVVAELVARDRLELLRKSTYQTSQVLQQITLYDLAEIVLQDAGLIAADYWLNPTLQAIVIPYAWFEPVSHREALRVIAEAALGAVYCDRDGVLRVEAGLPGGSPVLTIGPSLYFRADNPMRPGEVANEVIVETQPLRPVDVPQEVYRSNEPVTVPASQTVSIVARYNERPVIEASASLGGAVNTVIQSVTYYGWGAEITLHNPGGSPEDVTLVIEGRPLKVLNRQRAVARDEDSIVDLGTLRYELSANPLVQTLAVAQQLADAILATAKDPRRDLELEWRGNPALLLGDVLASRGGSYVVIRQELEWAGALRGHTTGRKVSA